MSAEHDEMCASRQGRACNCGAEATGINIDALIASLDKAIRQRDEARAKAAAIQQLPADEGAIRAIVDALENEHRYVEKLAYIPAITESFGRMKMLAGMLERLANPPVFMPRET